MAFIKNGDGKIINVEQDEKSEEARKKTASKQEKENKTENPNKG